MPPSDVASTTSANSAKASTEREAPRRLDVVTFACNQGERRSRSANLQELIALYVLGKSRGIGRDDRLAVGQDQRDERRAARRGLLLDHFETRGLIV